MAAPMVNSFAQARHLLLAKSLNVRTINQHAFKLTSCINISRNKFESKFRFSASNFSSCTSTKRGCSRPRHRPLLLRRCQFVLYSSRHDRSRERNKLFGSRLDNNSNKQLSKNDQLSGVDDTSLLLGFTGIVIAVTIFAFYMQKGDFKDEIAVLISKALVAERRNQQEEAEALLHEALQIAQKSDRQEAVTYTLDQMANLALRNHQDDKAEKLIKETIKHLVANGFDKTSNAVVELSVKLANIYSKFNKYEEAESGYDWCITTLESKIQKVDDSNDLQEVKESHEIEEEFDIKALLGMSLENYAKLLTKQKRYAEAETAYLKAIEICQNDLSTEENKHPQNVVLLNDLGALYHLQKKYKEAITYLEKAIETGKSVSHPYLSTALSNLASCQMYMGDFESAKTNYRKSLQLAEKEGDRYTIKFIKDMVAQLETERYLKEHKKAS